MIMTNKMKAECWDTLKRATINVAEDKTKCEEARNMGKEPLVLMDSIESTDVKRRLEEAGKEKI